MNNSQKPVFAEPELFVHGQIEDITEQSNNMNNLDLPIGTQTPPGTTLNDVTS